MLCLLAFRWRLRSDEFDFDDVAPKRADLFGNADCAAFRQGVELPDRCAGLDGSGAPRIDKLERPVTAFRPSYLSKFRLGGDHAIWGETRQCCRPRPSPEKPVLRTEPPRGLASIAMRPKLQPSASVASQPLPPQAELHPGNNLPHQHARQAVELLLVVA